MKYFKIFTLICFVLYIYSCGTIKEGFTNQKKNSSDEFLVEKKSPLVLPPDYDNLPSPDIGSLDNDRNENKIKDLVSTNENLSEKKNEINDSLEESLLKKIKKN